MKSPRSSVSPPQSMAIESFADMKLSEALLHSLEKHGYKKPSEIQQLAIPQILDNHDVIALAPTGSGKTATCAIPVCERIDTNVKTLQALIIVPTRELAFQYASELQKIGKSLGVKAFAMCGGEEKSMQEAKLAHCVHALVATPGRLIDFIYDRAIDLTQVNTLVLDEADEMLNMGFYEDLEFIIQCLIHEHQTLLFSATMPHEIRKIAKVHMKEPTEITLTKKEATPKLIHHQFLFCAHHKRDWHLADQLKSLKPKQSIIFCHSRIQSEKVAKSLKSQTSDVDVLHGGLNQNIRTAITQKFRRGRLRCLVATDVAARGLDFSQVSHVFIYQLSDDPDLYIHRAGRTGRFDKAGQVITLITPRELHALEKVKGRLKDPITWIGEPPTQSSSSHPSPQRHRRSPTK